MKALSFLCLLMLSIIACKSTAVDKNNGEINYKETVTIQDIPRSTLTFFDVSDSRCPEGAQCVWAGNATVDLALTGVTTEGGLTSHVSMCLGACGKKFNTSDTLDYEFIGQKYRFILNAVNPLPKAESPAKKENYSISLNIEKK